MDIGALTKNEGNKELPNNIFPVLLNVIFKLPVRPNLTQELNLFSTQQADTQQPRQSSSDHI
jgi:hypothetical protein